MADEFEQIEQEQVVPELFGVEELPDSAEEAFATAEEAVEGDDLVVSVEPQPEPLGRSWAFDFSSKRFVMAGHSPVETRREQTLLYWAEKCLRTPQGGSPIEPADYGFDSPSELFGETIDAAEVGTLEDKVREALLFHPAITGIENFELLPDEEDGEVRLVNFQIVLDDETRLGINTGVAL